jgi:hypothetical protein
MTIDEFQPEWRRCARLAGDNVCKHRTATSDFVRVWNEARTSQHAENQQRGLQAGQPQSIRSQKVGAEPDLEKTQATEVEAPKTPFAVRRYYSRSRPQKGMKRTWMQVYST